MDPAQRRIDLAHPRSLFIGGRWVEPISPSTFRILDSATEQVAATVAEAGVEDVGHAIAAARSAFDDGEWPWLAPSQRARYLRAIADELERRADELAHIWTLESGILFKLSSTRLVRLLPGMFRHFADLAGRFAFEEPRRASGGQQAALVREPVGVVGAIVPWNGPSSLMAYKCAPALLAGCTIVLKMAPEAPCAGYVFAEICEKVGLPPGVLNMVVADRKASEALVADARVDKITFTGSTVAGRAIASALGQRIARYTLELGGKSPAVILDDFDIGTAAEVIGGGVGLLTGQVCHSLTRIVVPRHRHDAMVDAVSAVFASMRVGDPYDPATDVGPLASARQRGSVEKYIGLGVEEGARLAFGGRRPPGLDQGFFLEPTLFADVDNRSTIGQEEIFGPVITVVPARDEEDAIRIANDTIYGLNASIFTNDDERFKALARRIRSGTVGQNASRTDVGIAFGGFKQSGVGREGDVEGLLPFLETKVVVTDRPAT